MTVLHQCADYLVRYNRVSDSPDAVVIFGPWSIQPTLEGEFFAEAFFRRRGINAIGVKSARNDWYQGEAMDEVLRSIRQATEEMHVVGYGGSMGAYAVINFADELRLDSLVAIGPQFSIDPLKVPFETRWDKEAREIIFRRDRIADVPRNAKGWILYDPQTTDVRHAELILAHHDFTPLKVYFADHHPLAVLQQAGLTEQLLLDLVHGRLNHGRFIRLLRQRRRSSGWVWLNLSKVLQSRGNIDGAIRAIETGKSVQTSDPFLLDVQHAGLLIMVGEFHRAMAMMTAYAGGPDHDAEARWLLDEWQKHYDNGLLPAPKG